MSIFTRRRTAVADWEPRTQEIAIIAVGLFNDPLADGERAYGARFGRPDNDGVLTIWAYAQYSGTADGYIVAFCIDRLNEDAPERDGDSTRYADAAWGEWFVSATAAESNALQAAVLLAAGDRGAALSPLADPDVIAGWFAWDGVPQP
jgi:hypothetical protein